MMKNIFYPSAIVLFLTLLVTFTSCKRNKNPKPHNNDTTVVKNPCVQGAPTFVWVRPLTDSATDFIGAATDVALGNDKNLLVSGYLVGSADFDPGPGVITLTATPTNGLYEQHVAPNGNFLGANLAPTPPAAPTGAIKRVRDAAGNYYTFGLFEGDYDFDPGPGIFTLSHHGPPDELTGEYYIQKLDASGNFKWAVLTGIILSPDFDSASFTMDNDGAVYAAGYMPGYEPDLGYGIIKFDTNGSLLWHKGSTFPNTLVLTTDSKKNIYAINQNPPADGANALVKYDSQGTQLSVTNLSLPATAYLNIKADAFDNIYVSGAANDGFFIEKHDPANQILWTMRCNEVYLPGDTPGRSKGIVNAIAVDPSGENVYAIGSYHGSVDFDPGNGATTLTAPFPYGKYFIAKYAQCH